MDILNNKVIKYGVLAIIIMILFTTLFNNTRINYKDSIMISLIIILAFIVIDNISNIYTPSTADDNILSTLEEFKNESYKLPSFITQQKGGNVILPEETKVVLPTPEEQKPIVTQEAIKVVSPTPEEQKPIVTPQVTNVVQTNSEDSNSSILSESEDLYVPKYKSDSRLASANVQERKGCRWEDDVITSDMKYTDYNHLPLADGYDSRDYEYGYSFLPPEKWYPQPPFPPVCVTNKKCDVFPMFTTGSNLDLKEWNSSLRITAPDNINVNYIREKLNSGR